MENLINEADKALKEAMAEVFVIGTRKGLTNRKAFILAETSSLLTMLAATAVLIEKSPDPVITLKVLEDKLEGFSEVVMRIGALALAEDSQIQSGVGKKELFALIESSTNLMIDAVGQLRQQLYSNPETAKELKDWAREQISKRGTVGP